MLLTLTTTHQPASDLGYLVHKNPARVQELELTFGTAHIVWPEVSEERATVALLVEVDPIGLVRGREHGPEAGPLAQYVNDRPYVASSLLSVALARAFGTAMSGRSKDRPELAQQAIPLQVRLSVLPCRGGEVYLRRLFEPLGYVVQAERLPRDEVMSELGESHLYRVELRITARLSEVLRHLYVLVPVLDDDKHYWVGSDEVDKLLAKGEGWLDQHPERDSIALRFLRRRHSLARQALKALVPDAPDADEEAGDSAEQGAGSEELRGEAALEKPMTLNARRLGLVTETLLATGATRVLDLGCGEGRLLERLLQKRQFTEVVGVDVSIACLDRAEARLTHDRRPTSWQGRLKLMQGSLTYRDRRLDGFDAAALIEVIEHLEPERLDALELALFAGSRPAHIVVTTPNAEYNVLFPSLQPGRFRHGDHRFEWDRATFAAWCARVAAAHGYEVQLAPIGDEHPEHGAPTQMGVFTRCR
jgi:3' terminal RNA ribose 2'-O-methyltransferase Hen1